MEAVADGSGFSAEGTPRTSWFVDLPPVPGQDGPRTLSADAVAAPGGGVDLDGATDVLDRVMARLQLQAVTTATP